MNNTSNLATFSNTTECQTQEESYIAVLFTFCIFGMLINIIVLLSAYWIRTPMTPILKMSLSLAAADLCSALIFGGSLYSPFNHTFIFLVEIMRLSCIVITAAHLLALSLNHFIGIIKPLHYNSIVTRRKVTAVIWLLWLLPSSLIGGLCAYQGGYQLDDQFMQTFSFRLSIALMFFIPMVLMSFFYASILIIVRKQQKRWKNLSRLGSTKWRGRAIKNCATNKACKEKKQLEGNIRAIWTTMLIMGSCLIGWLPSLFVYILMCNNCYFDEEILQDLNMHWRCEIMVFRLIENSLLLFKMIANPIIYSIRMKEIQDGRKRMYLAITSLCRKQSQQDTSNYSLAYQKSPLHHQSAASIQVRLTSFRTNGNSSSHVSIRRSGPSSDAANTFL